MIRDRAVAQITALADRLQQLALGTEWHLFGSVDRNDPSASDIDVIILCRDDSQANDLRRHIDTDEFSPPLDLSIFTYEEEISASVLALQHASLILKVNS